ncbi:hypothetical protein KEM48_001966 [Puccinia striiformis f. sp. tritici PST-130]|nr:hypothetical protein KEM48_001966 [Puccinia striiformis f. sp. tritici PST-130]
MELDAALSCTCGPYSELRRQIVTILDLLDPHKFLKDPGSRLRLILEIHRLVKEVLGYNKSLETILDLVDKTINSTKRNNGRQTKKIDNLSSNWLSGNNNHQALEALFNKLSVRGMNRKRLPMFSKMCSEDLDAVAKVAVNLGGELHQMAGIDVAAARLRKGGWIGWVGAEPARSKKLKKMSDSNPTDSDPGALDPAAQKNKTLGSKQASTCRFMMYQLVQNVVQQKLEISRLDRKGAQLFRTKCASERLDRAQDHTPPVSDQIVGPLNAKRNLVVQIQSSHLPRLRQLIAHS